MVYKNEKNEPQQTTTHKRNTGLKVAVALFLVLALLGWGAFAFLYFGGMDLFSPSEPPAPYIAQGEVRAVALAPPEDLSEGALRAYFAAAAEQAAANGFNTLLFEGKDGVEVYWRDRIFPAAPGLTEQDNWFASLDPKFAKVDPLAILCEEAGARRVQVWLAVDPYAAGNYAEGMKGKVADYADKQNRPTGFAPSDKEYSNLLLESLSALPQKYPLAGIVLDGDSALAEGGADPETTRAAFQSLAANLSAAMAQNGAAAKVGARFVPDTGMLTVDRAVQLAGQGSLAWVLPEIQPGDKLYARLAQWGSLGAGLVVTQPEEDPLCEVLFTAAGVPGYAGALMGEYPAVFEQSDLLAYQTSALAPAEGEKPVGFSLPAELAVNYPLSYDYIAPMQQVVYVMGTSDPAQPLTMNGAEVPRHTEGGTFGVLVDLQSGDNTFDFANGTAALSHVITRPEPSAGGGTATPMPEDNTREGKPGEAVQVVGVFTGALNDPGDDGDINETLYGGAVAVVRDSVQTVRYDSARGRNVKTWAYQLANGSWVLGRNSVFVGGDGASNFSSVSAEAAEGGEWINFEGSGTPAVWMADKDGTLAITMYDTSITIPEGFTSELVQSAWVEPIGGGVVLYLKGDKIWGYQVDYTDGRMRVYLNKAPVLSGDPAQPLSGVKVMLDPGHGADDVGAPGIMGPVGPNEKDVNLAQAQAIAYRLRQLGATVVMTRTDDTANPSTHERLAMLMAEKPDFFIGVHHNSATMEGDRNEVSGLQVYYYSDKDNMAPMSKGFGQNLMDQSAAASGREATESQWGWYNIIRTPVCPAVLFEYGFMVNPAEFEKISSTDGL